MSVQIIRAIDDQDFGMKSKQIFHHSMRGISDLPRVVLPTGSTPKPFYEALCTDTEPQAFHYLQLDEYHGLAPDDYILFSNWLARDVLDPLKIEHRMIFNSAADPAQEIERIKAWHRQQARIDVAVLGIGEDGHIGFNQPGTGFNDPAHMEELTEQTQIANQKYWGREVPKHVITLGLGELRMANHTILLARGEAKAEILHKALCGQITTDVPASYLQRQRNGSVVADEAALSFFPK